MSQQGDEREDVMSVHTQISKTSRSSIRSSASIAAINARAKAEAARARALFAQREIEMRVKQAQLKVEETRLDATLDALHHQRDAEAALAEATVYEAAANEAQDGSTSYPCSQVFNAAERTKAYVKDQMFQNDKVTKHDDVKTHDLPACPTLNPLKPEVCKPDVNTESHNSVLYNNNGNAGNLKPSQISSKENTNASDPIRLLARRELLTGGLVRFSDQPGDYWAWKSSFENVIRGLHLTASEELDLLTKWLGNESSKHAIRIRSVHINNPSLGLVKVWERLQECYGSPEAIEKALFDRLEHFPKITNKEPQLLLEFGDLLMEIDSAKSEGYIPGLLYLDTARGILPLVEKLPFSLQEKWITHGTRYKQEHSGSFPPFYVFAAFIRDQAKMRNDPSFKTLCFPLAPNIKSDKYQERHQKTRISVNKMDVADTGQQRNAEKEVEDPDKECPIHKKPHTLRKCRAFREKTLDERKTFLKQNRICFRCCTSSNHLARNCKFETQCTECGSDTHIAALHAGPAPWVKQDKTEITTDHGGEQRSASSIATSKCTQVCGNEIGGYSCAKICLVYVYPTGHYDKRLKTYAIMDDQSNKSLARSSFFDIFSVNQSSVPYTLKTCAGVVEVTGRRANNFTVESVDNQFSLPLPTLIECDMLPDNCNEIPTPEAACHHPHLRDIAAEIPPLDPHADILLLLGRDVIQAHKVLDQRNGPTNAPFAQRLALGWVIVGEVCLGRAHKPEQVNAFRTNVLDKGRTSIFSPCQNSILLKEHITFPSDYSSPVHCPENKPAGTDNLGETVFQQTGADEKPAYTLEECTFLRIMENEVYQDETNSWVAPLPFRLPRSRLPNNRQLAIQRLSSVHHTLKKRPKMSQHFLEFMQNIFDSGHAEPAPPLEEQEECWYLPFFGVYHPHKPDQIRVVFDSSAQHHGVSLNDILLTGPNLNNSLLGVLLRFRGEKVAVTADVKQMFHCFSVRKDHRNFLRFLWHRNNNLEEPIIEYRMTVHIFGNSPSPAVAIYGLRKASQVQEDGDSTTKSFVKQHFYVDDCLVSFPSDDEAITVVKRAQETLAASNLKLHKIASNSINVMKAFSKEDLAKGLKDLDLAADFPPMQRSLGINWDIVTDEFIFQVAATEKPYTRRGVLATVNSLYDPLGFAAPVSIRGRAILRELTAEPCEWDDPLPESKLKDWCEWKNSLKELGQVKIKRMYTPISLNSSINKELCIFSDASVQAIGAVAYIKLTDGEGKSELGFVFGKAKLAPQPAVTIPRLELCAAVLAVEIADMLLEEMDVQFHSVKFFTDSRVVLGYIRNESRRFYVYVSNRVQRIRKSSLPDQWNYVPTGANPADLASRSVPANTLMSSMWLKGPGFLLKSRKAKVDNEESFDLINPESDPEIRPLLKSYATQVTDSTLNPSRFESFSSWRSLLRTVSRLIHITSSFKKECSKRDCRGWHLCKNLCPAELSKAKTVIIHSLQHQAFPEVFACIQANKEIPKQSRLQRLSPYLDNSGCLRVGGRLSKADLENDERNPLIIPGHHHITTLLIRHYHEQVQHQGRHFTEGAVRSAGLWIIGGKRCISALIHSCITCRKLRWRTESQKMADLPVDRLSTDPPFSYVGVDVFGPWTVASRRTRGGSASSKRWAVIFSCMGTRAVHFEVIESMDSSSFINALRRFFSIRGPVKQFRSDCGTNFLGACKELGIDSKHCNNQAIQEFLSNNMCTWVFNPPHASHMGGSWERMIGITKRILDTMFMGLSQRQLTHEVLTTFLAEVTAIVNSRPLVPVSNDPSFPFILTPATLLTQKKGVPSMPPGNFEETDMYKRQWRQVQHLSNVFWHRWKNQYLSTLQDRRKWHSERPNLKEGDLVLLKDSQVKRNHWPMGIVVKAFPSHDGKVRKIEVRIASGGDYKNFLRPITDTVLLLPSSNNKDIEES